MSLHEYPKPRWGRIYAKHCPHNTDPTSRWVRMIGGWFRDKKMPLRAVIEPWDEPDRIADAIEQTVISLWEARDFLRSEGYERVQRKGKWVWVKRAMEFTANGGGASGGGTGC